MPEPKFTPRMQTLVFFGLCLLLWAGLSAAGFWPQYIFPSPFDVGRSFIEGMTDGAIMIATGASMIRLLLGFALSLLIGLPLGYLCGRSRLADRTAGKLLLGLQALPSICWLPLALLWFGLNDGAIIFVVFMGAVLSVALSARDGVLTINPLFIKAAENMGTRGMTMIVKVVLPASFPSVLTGMKLGWSFAWRSLMAGELLYGNSGLGQMLMMGRELNDMSRVLAIMGLIVIIGLVLDKVVFGPAERRIHKRWGRSR